MNAPTRALASASSPAMNTSSGRSPAFGRQDVAEDGVERLDDVRARRGVLAISCAAELSPRVTSPLNLGAIEGVGDVDDDLARKGVPVLGDDRQRRRVRHGEDDDVAGRDCAEPPAVAPPPSASARSAALAASRTDDLDGVAAR